MKLIHTLAAIIALSFISAPLARAQETETPTEKPSASPAEAAESASPAESAAPAMPATPAAEKSPAAKSKKAKARPAAKASPAADASAAAKASPAVAQKPAAKGSVESQLKEIENAYEAAVPSHNVSAIEPFTADDFVLTNSKNKVMNRRAALADFKKDPDTYTSANNLKITVHMAARNVAIVTGSSREIGKDKAGKAFDRTFLWTDTFVDRNGKWMVVASHASLVGNK